MRRHTTHKPRPIRSFHVGETTVLSAKGRGQILFDPYHFVLTLTWPRFFGLLVLMFLALNLSFGAAYWAIPGSVNNARPDHFFDYFFFSIETLATVGYGAMSPANLGGHITASIEIMLGMAGVALTTGLIFARFAKPKARILFSKQAVVREFDGQRMLMMRIANERYNRIVDASAMMSIVRAERTADGETYYRIHDLKLLRDHTQVFNLTWSLMHPIDEHSPLHGCNGDRLRDEDARIVVSVSGHDETVAASVYAVNNYDSADVVFDARFADVLRVNEDGSSVIDLTRFHEVERVTPKT